MIQQHREKRLRGDSFQDGRWFKDRQMDLPSRTSLMILTAYLCRYLSVSTLVYLSLQILIYIHIYLHTSLRLLVSILYLSTYLSIYIYLYMYLYLPISITPYLSIYLSTQIYRSIDVGLYLRSLSMQVFTSHLYACGCFLLYHAGHTTTARSPRHIAAFFLVAKGREEEEEEEREGDFDGEDWRIL